MRGLFAVAMFVLSALASPQAASNGVQANGPSARGLDVHRPLRTARRLRATESCELDVRNGCAGSNPEPADVTPAVVLPQPQQLALVDAARLASAAPAARAMECRRARAPPATWA